MPADQVRSSVTTGGEVMAGLEVKRDLHTYLRDAREVLAWKMDGLGEYDVRRPLTPTGTNLLGLVKHSATSHVRYFGGVFGRAADAVVLPWASPGSDPTAEMWATPAEATDEIVALARRAWAHADATITGLPLDATSSVPWWGGEEVTLHRVLVHVTAETQRHAGHADIVRELIDGAAGLLPAFDNLWAPDLAARSAFHDRVEAAARLAGDPDLA
jgi:hypothetical protein